MHRVALIIAFSLLPFAALGGTFELSDPANEMYEEQNEPPAEQEAPEPQPLTGLRCNVDIDTGACVCTEKETGMQAPLTEKECAVQVTKALDTHF